MPPTPLAASAYDTVLAVHIMAVLTTVGSLLSALVLITILFMAIKP
jgi:hypothetical protein